MNTLLKNTPTKLDYFFNSIASRKRIEILITLSQNENLNLKDISKIIKTNPQNASLHTYKLLNSGLIAKRKNKNKVEHILTRRGKKVVKFILEIDKNL